jgi:hypothetical protein
MFASNKKLKMKGVKKRQDKKRCYVGSTTMLAKQRGVWHARFLHGNIKRKAGEVPAL